jgi:repressor of nif and glnA expression
VDKKERNRLALLEALSKIGTPATSERLAEFLAAAGQNLSARTIRLYLSDLDAEELTRPHGKRRVITDKGLAELRAAQTVQRVGCLSAKIDQMTYDMTFDLITRTGLVVVNTSLVAPQQLAECQEQIARVFAGGYAMGHLLAILPPGEHLGDIVVPEGMVGFCTVCSITLNGVLLKHGVPVSSRFGGLVELRGGRPARFVEMIYYEGTTIDPLEVFIRSGMTNYCGAIKDGNGLIGASFREMPENCRDLAVQLADRVSTVGLGGFMEIGWPGQPVLGFPVTPGRIGVVIVGGLNPIAVLEEQEHRVLSRALAGLLEYSRLVHFDELPQALEPYL